MLELLVELLRDPDVVSVEKGDPVACRAGDAIVARGRDALVLLAQKNDPVFISAGGVPRFIGAPASTTMISSAGGLREDALESFRTNAAELYAGITTLTRKPSMVSSRSLSLAIDGHAGGDASAATAAKPSAPRRI